MAKKNFKRKVLGVTCALCFSALYANTASAAYPVTNYTLDPYLMGFTSGNGLIETLVSMNDKLAQATISNNENQKNEALNNANQAIQQQRMENALKRTPSANACEEVTSAGGRGSSGSNTSSAKEALSDSSVEIFTQASDPRGEAYKNTKGRVDLDVCSAEDIKFNRGGCSSVGQYPDKDKSSGSLTNPPLSRDEAANKKVSNQSYNEKQLKIAETAKRNVIGNLPVEPLNDKALENTQEGREFLSAFASFTTRSTAGTNAIDSILAMKKGSDVAVNSRGTNIGSGLNSTQGANLAWSDASVKQKYETLFPGATFPTKPSEWEMLRYEIYSRYADTTGPSAWQVLISSADEKESLREIARMQAIQLRLTMLQVERQEDANIIAAAQLGAELQPVDKATLVKLRANALSANQGSTK